MVAINLVQALASSLRACEVRIPSVADKASLASVIVLARFEISAIASPFLENSLLSYILFLFVISLEKCANAI